MTHPTPTQGAQSEAARVPRVSDATFSAICDRAAYDAQLDDATTFQMIALDSRDKDAMIADLERRLATMEHERVTNWRSHVDIRAALQAQLTEAEQRAATAWRRGFEACRDAAASIAALHYSTRHWQLTVKQVGGKIADAIRALAPAVPQEGETTP